MPREKLWLYYSEVMLLMFSALLALCTAAFSFDAVLYADFQLLILVAVFALNYFRLRRISLYLLWILAYIFIVWAEMRILAPSDRSLVVYGVPFTRYTLANVAVLLGYHANKQPRINLKKFVFNEYNTRWFIWIVIALEAYYVFSSISSIMEVLAGRRGAASALGGGTLTGAITNAIGLLLPAFIAFYFKYIRKKNILVSLLVSSPVFVVLFFRATRYKFLFSVLPFLVILDILNLKEYDKKKNILLIVCAILILSLSSFVKSNRMKEFEEWDSFSLIRSDTRVNSFDPLTLKLAKNMSSEGVVSMAEIADEYFNTHPLHWGKETSFLLYFWVPRSIWPDKPTQLDYWLIREYESVSEGYSSASGFIGELRADFGWGCIFFLFIFGCLVKRLDYYSVQVFNDTEPSLNMILAACFFPWVFFFVRSPVTSTMSMFWELLLYYLLCRLFAIRS